MLKTNIHFKLKYLQHQTEKGQKQISGIWFRLYQTVTQCSLTDLITQREVIVAVYDGFVVNSTNVVNKYAKFRGEVYPCYYSR